MDPLEGPGVGLSAAQFARHHLCVAQLRPRGRHEIIERGEPDLGARVEFRYRRDQGAQVGAERVMIGADKDGDVPRGGAPHQVVTQGRPCRSQPGWIARQRLSHFITGRRQVIDRQRRAVRRPPVEEVALACAPAPQDDAGKPELVRQHWQRRWVAEGVRRVEGAALAAQRAEVPPALQQVPNERFRRWDQLIHQHTRRPGLQLACGHQGGNLLVRLGAHCQVVFDDNRLAIKQEREPGRRAERAPRPVQHRKQPGQECRPRAIPLPVPMGVRNQVKNGRFHALICAGPHLEVFTILPGPSKVSGLCAAFGPRGRLSPGRMQ